LHPTRSEALHQGRDANAKVDTRLIKEKSYRSAGICMEE